MVNFGGYLKAVQNGQTDHYIVPYSTIKEIILSGDNLGEFEVQWKQALQQANQDFSSSLEKDIWVTLFASLDAQEARGAPLGTALVNFVQNNIATKAQELLSRMVHLHTVAVSNTEALRKLCKKYDKMHPSLPAKSGLLLPILYSSQVYMSQPLLENSSSTLRTLLDATTSSDGLERSLGNNNFLPVSRMDSEQLHAQQVQQRMQEFDWLSRLVETIPPETHLPKLVAHRGFHHIADRSDKRPLENSLAAYEIAWTNGIHLCECDIALTKDEKLVLAHDEDFSRLALQSGGSKKYANMKVSDLTFRELMSLPLKTGMRPPLLLDVLQSAHAISDHAQLVIEIKPGNAEAASALARLLVKHQELCPCVAMIMSFDAFTMHRLRRELYAMMELKTPVEAGVVSSVTSRLSLAAAAATSTKTTNMHRNKVPLDHFGTIMTPSSSDGLGMNRSEPEFSAGDGLGYLEGCYPAEHNIHLQQHVGELENDYGSNVDDHHGIIVPKDKPKPNFPRLMLLTVSDPPQKACGLQVTVNDLAPVESWLTGEHGTLDGVYLQFELDMMTEQGAAKLRELARRYYVGIWAYSGKDPDDYNTFDWLVSHCDVTYVNTDLPTHFQKGIHKRGRAV